MTEFELEDEVVSILLNSELFEVDDSGKKFILGDVFKLGTRTEIQNEDIVVEILSIDSEQFQTALVSVRVYVDDLNIGSPIPVPNISRLSELTRKFEDVFKTRNSAYSITTSKYRMRLESIKRERKEELRQHCVNCMFNFSIRNF